jgi:TolB-like protein/predicted Zn-dependent protease
MGARSARVSTLIADLKRRRVFRLAAFYTAGIWTLVVVVATLIPLGLPADAARWVVLVAIGGFPVALVLGWYFDFTPGGVRLTPPRPDLAAVFADGTDVGIAVLPLLDLSEAGDAANLADGIGEEVRNALARVDGLRVVARTAALAHRGRDRDPRPIGRELGVDYVLDGGVRRSGDRLRIGLQLVRVDDGVQTLSEMYERDLDDVFGLQEDVARAIARVLERKLAGDSTAVAPIPEAYAAYLEGLHHLGLRTPTALREAQERFDLAVTADVAFAPAHAALAETLALLGDVGVVPARAAYERAKAAARCAVELDDALPAAHAVLGFARTLDWDWSGVERHFLRALELDGDNARARHWYALYLTAEGRVGEAVTQAEAAHAQDPGSTAIAGVLAGLYCYAYRPERALAFASRILAAAPTDIHARLIAALAHEQRGELDPARQALRQAMLEGGPRPVLVAAMGHVQATAGRPDEARAALARLDDMASDEQVPPFCRAALHVVLGEADNAFLWLERGRAERDGWMLAVRAHPWLEPIRGDERYRDLIRSMGWPVSDEDEIAA